MFGIRWNCNRDFLIYSILRIAGCGESALIAVPATVTITTTVERDATGSSEPSMALVALRNAGQRLHENAEVVGTDEAFFEEDDDDQIVRDLFTEKAGILKSHASSARLD